VVPSRYWHGPGKSVVRCPAAEPSPAGTAEAVPGCAESVACASWLAATMVNETARSAVRKPASLSTIPIQHLSCSSCLSRRAYRLKDPSNSTSGQGVRRLVATCVYAGKYPPPDQFVGEPTGDVYMGDAVTPGMRWADVGDHGVGSPRFALTPRRSGPTRVAQRDGVLTGGGVGRLTWGTSWRTIWHGAVCGRRSGCGGPSGFLPGSRAERREGRRAVALPPVPPVTSPAATARRPVRHAGRSGG
jgi:hypothetical protein